MWVEYLNSTIRTLEKHEYKVTEINQKGKHVKLRINNRWVVVSATPKHKGVYKKTLSYLRREEAKAWKEKAENGWRKETNH